VFACYFVSKINPTKEVPSMRSIKRELFYGVAMSVFVFTCALAWGRPFTGTSPAQAQEQQQPAPPPQQEQPQTPPQQAQPQQPQDQAQSAIFTGTVVRDGEQFMLRDSTGQTFKLDDADRAKPFEGKAVKVTGKLDTEAKVIHVDTIQGVEA
jgi:hypothetical protein